MPSQTIATFPSRDFALPVIVLTIQKAKNRTNLVKTGGIE